MRCSVIYFVLLSLAVSACSEAEFVAAPVKPLGSRALPAVEEPRPGSVRESKSAPPAPAHQSEVVVPAPTLAPVMDAPSLPVVVNSCAASSRAELQTKVDFAPQENRCAFGQRNNLVAQEGVLAARIEQQAIVDLPPGAIVCDVAFAFSSQQLRYDDHLLLVLNDFILAASHLDRDFFPINEKLIVYDWVKLRGMPFSNGAEQPFCLGGGAGACDIPPSESNGQFALTVPEGKMLELAAAIRDAKQLAFKLVTTGDNDDGKDCQHSGLEFDLAVHFVVPGVTE